MWVRLRKFGFQPWIAVFEATSDFRFGHEGTIATVIAWTFEPRLASAKRRSSLKDLHLELWFMALRTAASDSFCFITWWAHTPNAGRRRNNPAKRAVGSSQPRRDAHAARAATGSAVDRRVRSVAYSNGQGTAGAAFDVVVNVIRLAKQ